MIWLGYKNDIFIHITISQNNLYVIPFAFEFWNPMDIPGSVEEDEGVVISFIVASNVVFEVDGWLWIMGLREVEAGMDVDDLVLVYWFANVDDCCLPPPSAWLYDYKNKKKSLRNL